MTIHLEGPIDLYSDASAAKGISNHGGSGEVRHIEVTQLWLQHKVNSHVIAVHQVGSEEDLTGALTNGVDSYAIVRPVEGVGMELGDDRHTMYPALEESASAEAKLEGE